MTMKKKRIVWADSLKGLLMVLVILRHAIQTVLAEGCFNDHVFNLIYSFHMPAFMAVSGYFAYKANNFLGNACKRRSKQLLIPYLLWSLISCLIGWNLSWDKIANLLLYPDRSFWFLWILFLISVIFVGCQWVADKLKIDELLSIGLSAIALFGLMVVFEIRLFGFQFLSYYFLFYTLGYCIHRFSWLQIKNNVLVLGLFILWSFMAWFCNMHELPLWMPAIPYVPTSLLQYAYRGLTAVVALLVIFGVSPKWLNGESNVNGCFKELGSISLGLYVVHLLLLGYVRETVVSVMPNNPIWLQMGTIFIILLVLSVGIVEMLKRNKWTAKLLLGKV